MFIAKELVALSFVEVSFLRRLILSLNPRVSFPSEHQLMNDILLKLAEKTKKNFIYQAFEAYDTCTVSFDLWMSRGVDTFVLIVHFLNHNWGPGHVTIDLSKTTETSGGYHGHTSE